MGRAYGWAASPIPGKAASPARHAAAVLKLVLQVAPRQQTPQGEGEHVSLPMKALLPAMQPAFAR